jgi:2'-5' RNA ligase
MLTKEGQNACMEPLIAVDVAILPPPEIAQTAVALNAGLPVGESKGLRLDAAHLPHVTLTQQFVMGSAVPDVAGAVARVLRDRPPFPLTITGPGRGSSSVWMRIALTPDLQDLHRALMDALQPFECDAGGTAAFAGSDARPGDVDWVTSFRRSSSYGRFAPHITVGHASTPPHVEPQSFRAEIVALCRLGRFCTCGEVLRSWSLGHSDAAEGLRVG